jgi:hypothetical protein
VERQRAALEGVDAEAEEESGASRELAAAMCTRLDAARRAAEKLLGVLQARAFLHMRRACAAHAPSPKTSRMLPARVSTCTVP